MYISKLNRYCYKYHHKKLNGKIDSNTIIEVFNNKGITHSLRNIESTVKVEEYSFSCNNIPHFIRFINPEIDIRDYQ